MLIHISIGNNVENYYFRNYSCLKIRLRLGLYLKQFFRYLYTFFFAENDMVLLDCFNYVKFITNKYHFLKLSNINIANASHSFIVWHQSCGRIHIRQFFVIIIYIYIYYRIPHKFVHDTRVLPVSCNLTKVVLI